MKINNLTLIIILIFVLIIVGLFIECGYNKNHASMIFIAPEKILVIKGKNLGEKDDIIIYNSEKCSIDEAIEKVAKTKRNRYHEQKICEHISKKISKPFDESYKDLKENFVENMPVSFIYKTAFGIADVVRSVASPSNSISKYRMLISNDQKHMAFIDNNNIYLK